MAKHGQINWNFKDNCEFIFKNIFNLGVDDSKMTILISEIFSPKSESLKIFKFFFPRKII